MKRKSSLFLLLAFVFSVNAFSQNTPVNLEANDTARFLAGLPPSPGSPLAEYAKDPAWQEHARYFDTAWASLEKNQLSKVRAWDATYIPEAAGSHTPVFYMFSGPDYLYVDAFYPNASTYVLCGIEPVGPVPDITKLRSGSLPEELRNLQTSLNSVLNFSFFITKDMKNDLQSHTLNGTLPILYIFLARSNKTINEVGHVGLDSDGKLHLLETEPSSNHGTLIPGVKITFSQPDAAQPQTLYYFSTDISDDGLKKAGGILKFCQEMAPANSFVKSASYLMHESYFSSIRTFLLNNSRMLIQDDSGIPLSYFKPDKWQMRYFGSYPGPIDIFKKYTQPELALSYQKSNPVPLDFGIGYRHHARQSTLIVATRKPGESPSPTEESPAVARPAAGSPAEAPVAQPAPLQ